MTHSDIYTKFMIEYDKANITSSYPSLTRYEVATILDKAYLALIAQKLTGNNQRKAAFESDIKALEDLRPLIKDQNLQTSGKSDKTASNCMQYKLPTDYLYFISAFVKSNSNVASIDDDTATSHLIQGVSLISHEAAQGFIATSNNLPWIENPVCYIQGDKINLLYDQYAYKNNTGSFDMVLTFVYQPNKFVTGKGYSDSDYDFGDTKFELNDTMAEELINLAIIMSTEITESSRLTTKINTRPLES